jgi:hypothetical protein
MREDSRKTGQEHHEPAAPSRERRLLLKAAATAAPIIATLPQTASLKTRRSPTQAGRRQ